MDNNEVYIDITQSSSIFIYILKYASTFDSIKNYTSDYIKFKDELPFELQPYWKATIYNYMITKRAKIILEKNNNYIVEKICSILSKYIPKKIPYSNLIELGLPPPNVELNNISPVSICNFSAATTASSGVVATIPRCILTPKLFNNSLP